MARAFTKADFLQAYPAERRAFDSQYVWMGPMAGRAFYPTKWLLRAGLSPNQVTWMSLACVACGTGLLATGFYPLLPIGVLMFSLWHMLDCADGVMARHLGCPSHYGAFLDTMGYHVANLGLWIGAGVGQALGSDPWLELLVPWAGSPWLFVALGLAAALFQMAGDFVSEIFEKQFRPASSDGASHGPQVLRAVGWKGRIEFMRLNITSVGGIVFPVLLLATIFRFLSMILLVYAVLYLLDFLARFALHIRRAWQIDHALQGRAPEGG